MSAATTAAAAAAMEVNAEARRILAVSISKLYASRTQRGGLRLHRSLLLSLVMRSARDIYHSSRESEAPEAQEEKEEEVEKEVEWEKEQPMETGSSSVEQTEPQPELISEQKEQKEEKEEKEEEVEEELEGCDSDDGDGEFTEDKENRSPAARQSRKRRGKASAAPDFLPSKRARLEPGEERYSCHRAAAAASAGTGVESLTALSLNLNLNLNRVIVPAF